MKLPVIHMMSGVIIKMAWALRFVLIVAKYVQSFSVVL